MAIETRPCLTCGVLFRPYKSNQQYHDRPCRDAAARHRREQEKHDETLMVPRVCLTCNQEKPHTAFTGKYAKSCILCNDARQREKEKKKREKYAKRAEDETIVGRARKVCGDCKQKKPLCEYPRTRGSRSYKERENTCRDCMKEKRQAKLRIKNQRQYEKISQEKREFLLSMPFNERVKYQERQRFEGYLRVTYGISIARYEYIKAEQNNLCAICGNPPEENGQLVIDHNHNTGSVRGLLCHQCNVGLGFFKENTTNLQNAVEYLKKFIWIE